MNRTFMLACLFFWYEYRWLLIGIYVLIKIAQTVYFKMTNLPHWYVSIIPGGTAFIKSSLCDMKLVVPIMYTLFAITWVNPSILGCLIWFIFYAYINYKYATYYFDEYNVWLLTLVPGAIYFAFVKETIKICK